jgi:glycerol kinase
MVRARTGLDLDPMFSASKMAWLLDNIVDGHQRAADGAIRLGTIDTWLLHCLSDGRQFATDLTNASRTLACNINDLDWDPELLDLFAIPRVALAQVLGSSDDFGEVTLGPLAGVAIRSMIGDSHASLVGHGALRTGSMKATFGTGTSVMAPIGNQTSIPTLSGAIAWSRGSSTGKPSVVRAIEGNIYATGAALEWTAALLGLPEGAAGLEALAVRARADSEAELVPAFSGLGAPHWNATARGIMTGLTRADGPAEVARAAIDAVAHQVADVTDLVVDLIGSSVHALAVDGGAIHSDLLAQRVADLTGLDVWRNEQSDLSAVGAGLLAGWQLGVWADEEAIVALPRPGARFSPTGSGDERAAQRDRWRRAVDRALSMPR